MTPITIHAELYADKGRKYRFRFRSSNGRIVATSGENFYTGLTNGRAIANARRAARKFLEGIGADPKRVEVKVVE